MIDLDYLKTGQVALGLGSLVDLARVSNVGIYVGKDQPKTAVVRSSWTEFEKLFRFERLWFKERASQMRQLIRQIWSFSDRRFHGGELE
jgi:hypothetical protein